MAITTAAQLKAALKGIQRRGFHRSTISGSAAGFSSLWTAGGGGTPASGSGETVDVNTTGSLPFTAAPAGQSTYVTSVEYVVGTSAVPFLADRLVQTSGLSGTSVAAQAVNTVALSRYTTGKYVQAFLEVYTAIGNVAVDATVSYTNQSGVAGRTGVGSFPASGVVGRLVPVRLQAGDYGVRSVQSVTLSGSTGTVGNFGVTLAKIIGQFNTSDFESLSDFDYASSGCPLIDDTACLWWFVLTNTTSTGILNGFVSFGQG